MPFWESVRRCENCALWRQNDPSFSTGFCDWKPERRPFYISAKDGWAPPRTTSYTDGSECAAYVHVKRKPHPLDKSTAMLVKAQVGDLIPLRTWSIVDKSRSDGDISRTEARVLSHSKKFVVVRAWNTTHRIRVRASVRERAGTVIGMEDWGLDVGRPIQKRVPRTEHPERAVGMLRKVRAGGTVPIIGYPPLDGVTRDAKVLVVAATHLVIRIGRRKVQMIRTGPQAGIIPGEVFTLNTTESSDASPQTTDPEQGAEATQGHEAG